MRGQDTKFWTLTKTLYNNLSYEITKRDLMMKYVLKMASVTNDIKHTKRSRNNPFLCASSKINSDTYHRQMMNCMMRDNMGDTLSTEPPDEIHVALRYAINDCSQTFFGPTKLFLTESNSNV